MTMPDDRPQKLAAGPVAIIGQSGGIAMAIKRTLEERGVDSGSAITSAMRPGLTTADYIAYFAQSPGVKVIVSYLESVHDTMRSFALAACARDWQAGGRREARRVRRWPRRSVGAYRPPSRFDGSVRRGCGCSRVMRVANFDAVVEAVEYCVHAPLPKGRGPGAVTFSADCAACCLMPPLRMGWHFHRSVMPRAGSWKGWSRSAPSSAIRWMQVSRH
jgi:acetyltransferase